jgi:hypothetical protein
MEINFYTKEKEMNMSGLFLDEKELEEFLKRNPEEAERQHVIKNLRKCRFHKICPYYRLDAYTCQHPTAEDGYCGKYREYAKVSIY